jgi:urea carboxylase
MGGKITCIFPMATPCGLHIIGQSPAPLWSQNQGGAVLSAGDKVRFMPISLREYDRMQAEGISLLPATRANFRDAA